MNNCTKDSHYNIHVLRVFYFTAAIQLMCLKRSGCMAHLRLLAQTAAAALT